MTHQFGLNIRTTRDRLEQVVRATGMVNPVYAEDERGHYVASYESVHPLMDTLPEHPVAPAVKPARKAPSVRPTGSGTCARIHEWVLANPQATRQDAVAQFPDANPSTVGVQFGHARRG